MQFKYPIIWCLPSNKKKIKIPLICLRNCCWSTFVPSWKGKATRFTASQTGSCLCSTALGILASSELQSALTVPPALHPAAPYSSASKHQCYSGWHCLRNLGSQKTNTRLRTWPMPECSLLNFHADSDCFCLATQMCIQDWELSCLWGMGDS